MATVTQAGSSVVTGITSLQQLLLFVLVGSFIWFVITLIIMLVLASKGHKKGQVLTVFIVMQVIYFILIIVGYFNMTWVAGMVGA